MYKKIISLLTILSMTLVLFAGVQISVSAEEVASGGCGSDGVTDTTSNVKWSLDDGGVLTISGTGDMHNYTYTYADNLPWYNSRSTITSVVIEDGVTSIGGYAFIECSNLTSVTIPNGVTEIEAEAFRGCSSLTSIEIPDSVTSFGTGAFRGCSSLETVNIPNSVRNTGVSVFYDCSSLKSVTISNNLTNINSYMFKNCSSLETVTIPKSVSSIYSDAFTGCTSLNQIIYKDGINVSSTSIPDTTTHIKYTVSDSKVTISAITDKDGNDISGTVEIPTTIDGMDVVAVAEDYRGNVDTTNHNTHTGGTATCKEKAECAICGNKYGNLSAHNYGVNGICTVCGAPDPNAGNDDDNNDDDNNDDNNDDSSISLSVENNTLTISGTGAVDDLSDLDGKESIKDVVIEDGITSVGENAFDGFENLETVYYPKDTAVSDNAFPEDVTQVEYSVNGDGDVIIEDIKQGDVISDGDKVVIPDKIGGMDVAGVAEEVKPWVSAEGHEHKGGTATCSALAVCSVCASEYGELDPNYHTYVNGVCTGCNAADPDAEPVVTTPTESEPTVTEPTGSSPTGTSPVGSTPVIPSRPSAPSNPSSPAVTTAAAETTTVTVTTAEEIIADNDYTGEDVSAGARAYSDDGITDMSMAVIIMAIAAVIACAVIIKKIVF